MTVNTNIGPQRVTCGRHQIIALLVAEIVEGEGDTDVKIAPAKLPQKIGEIRRFEELSRNSKII